MFELNGASNTFKQVKVIRRNSNALLNCGQRWPYQLVRLDQPSSRKNPCHNGHQHVHRHGVSNCMFQNTQWVSFIMVLLQEGKCILHDCGIHALKSTHLIKPHHALAQCNVMSILSAPCCCQSWRDICHLWWETWWCIDINDTWITRTRNNILCLKLPQCQFLDDFGSLGCWWTRSSWNTWHLQQCVEWQTCWRWRRKFEVPL